MSYSEPLGPQPNKAARSFPACKGEIIGRLFVTVIPFIPIIFLAVGLGFVNTDAAAQLPHVSNCSIDISTLDPNFLRRSVNIYCGVFVAALSVAFIYQIFAIVIRTVNIGFINQYDKCFIRFDIFINTIFLTVVIGGIVGAHSLAWLWGSYSSAVNSELEKNYSADVRRSVGGVSAGLWGAFGSFIGSIYQYYNIVVNMVAFIARGGKNCNNKATEREMEEFQSNK